MRVHRGSLARGDQRLEDPHVLVLDEQVMVLWRCNECIQPLQRINHRQKHDRVQIRNRLEAKSDTPLWSKRFFDRDLTRILRSAAFLKEAAAGWPPPSVSARWGAARRAGESGREGPDSP
jgi:hypothetical protein